MIFELRRWSEAYRDAFAEMHRDPEVMADLGGPAIREASDAEFDRYRDSWDIHGISRWAVTDAGGHFLGYSGVLRRNDPSHPLGHHFEVGWRFCRNAWDKGLATGSAHRALEHAWTVVNASAIYSYTASDNRRSRKSWSGFASREPRRSTSTHVIPWANGPVSSGSQNDPQTSSPRQGDRPPENRTQSASQPHPMDDPRGANQTDMRRHCRRARSVEIRGWSMAIGRLKNRLRKISKTALRA